MSASKDYRYTVNPNLFHEIYFQLNSLLRVRYPDCNFPLEPLLHRYLPLPLPFGRRPVTLKAAHL